jgi:hypothetical protein
MGIAEIINGGFARYSNGKTTRFLDKNARKKAKKPVQRACNNSILVKTLPVPRPL